MQRVRLAASWLLLLLLLLPVQSQAQSTDPALEPQSAASASMGPSLARQPDRNSSTLEIAPQPSTFQAPREDVEAAPRAFQPSNDTAALNRGYHPNGPDDGRRPYLGVELQYTTQCFLGMEVRGFEVLSVTPDSPAARAGLRARKPGTALGDLETFGSVMAFPLALFTIPRLRRSGALGMPGDVIVAVDDRRVRTEQELMDALYPLRAGDTAYLTVIRPLVGGGHTTARITLHIDRTLPAPRDSTSR